MRAKGVQTLFTGIIWDALQERLRRFGGARFCFFRRDRFAAFGSAWELHFFNSKGERVMEYRHRVVFAVGILRDDLVPGC